MPEPLTTDEAIGIVVDAVNDARAAAETPHFITFDDIKLNTLFDLCMEASGAGDERVAHACRLLMGETVPS